MKTPYLCLLTIIFPLLTQGCSVGGVNSNTQTNANDNTNLNGDDTATPTFALGSGVDLQYDPTPFGLTIQNEAQELVPDDSAEPVDALPLAVAPEGALLGIALDDGTRLFMMGTSNAETQEATLAGAVLEDLQGNLIFKQDVRDAGTTLTYATGDVVDIDASDEGLTLVYHLNATDPPSTLHFSIDSQGDVELDEAASILYGSLNDTYNLEPIRLPRATASPTARFMQQDETICFLVNSANNVVEGGCALWSLITAKAPTRALDVGCTTINGFLDELRGSSPFPNLPGLPSSGDEIAPKLIGSLKVSTSVLCGGLKSGWNLARLLKKLSPPDLFCFSSGLASEMARWIAPNGQSVATNICEEAQRRFGEPPPLPPIPEGDGCSDTCETANDGTCDDGGPFAEFSNCTFGTDCQDCGVRGTLEPPATQDCFDDGFCNIECPLFDPDINCTSEQLCSANDVCCPNDGLCDITSCTDAPDPDCSNLHYCDRQEICCAGDGRCDDTSDGCPEVDEDCALCAIVDGSCTEDCTPEDPDCHDDDCPVDAMCDTSCEGNDADCEFCGSDGICIDGCAPSDPDCSDQDCPADGECEEDCPGQDVDCDGCGEDGTCITGCTPEDPDCDTTEGSFTIVGYKNFDDSMTGEPDISLSGKPAAPTFQWNVTNVFAISVTSGATALYGIQGQKTVDDEIIQVAIPSTIAYGNYGISDTAPLDGIGGPLGPADAVPLKTNTLYSVTAWTLDGRVATLSFMHITS